MPRVCADSYRDATKVVHVCHRSPEHRGAHTCGLDSHNVPSCDEGCCFEHPEDGSSWANTPLNMALAQWSIEKAEPGDIALLDRQHPPHRAVEVIWNGKEIVVVRQENHEVAYRHSAWSSWYIVDRPSLLGAS